MNSSFIVPPFTNRASYLKKARLSYIPNLSQEEKDEALYELNHADLSSEEKLRYAMRLSDEELLSQNKFFRIYEDRDELIDMVRNKDDAASSGMLSEGFLLAKKGKANITTDIFFTKDTFYDIRDFVYSFFEDKNLSSWVSPKFLKESSYKKTRLPKSLDCEIISYLKFFDNCPERGEMKIFIGGSSFLFKY